MQFDTHLLEARFVKRLNRFVAEVELKGEVLLAHIPNTGRMCELLVPGRLCGLLPQDRSLRKTGFNLVMVKYLTNWVVIDSGMANTLFAEGWKAKFFPPFVSDFTLEKEVLYKRSRLDFKSSGPNGSTLVEVKSVNLVINGVAMFPDAPTKRGSRHLNHLIEAKEEGLKSALYFIVMRSDAMSFIPHLKMDQEFAINVKKAIEYGVKVHAYTCQVSPEGVFLDRAIPVNVEELMD